MSRFIPEVEHHLVGYRFVELVRVDVRAEDVARERLIRAQQRRAGEADEDGPFQPPLHLFVERSALRTMTLIHEHVKRAVPRRGRPLQVLRIELVQQRAHHARRGSRQLTDELRPRGHAHVLLVFADHARVLHHARDLLVQFVAVGDHENARARVVLQQPLGQQHHENAFATPLRVPDHAPFALGNARLRCLDAEVLMLARDLLAARIEDHEVANEIEQTSFVAELRQRAVEQCTRGEWCARLGRLAALPLHEELFGRTHGAVVQSLRVIPGEQQLRGGEEPLVEDVFLIRDQLPNAVGHLH